MPKANITYKAVGNDEKAEWGDYDHLMQRWEGLSKSVAKQWQPKCVNIQNLGNILIILHIE